MSYKINKADDKAYWNFTILKTVKKQFSDLYPELAGPFFRSCILHAIKDRKFLEEHIFNTWQSEEDHV